VNPQRALEAFTLPYKYEFARNKWINGEWRQNADSILLKTVDSSEDFRYDTVSDCFFSNDNDEQFHALKNTEMIEEIVFFYSEIVNRMKMEENRHSKNVMVNQGAFGKGIVFKNFNYNNPINI
jgi:hypothetical protein